jgi:hypothetical protein
MAARPQQVDGAAHGLGPPSISDTVPRHRSIPHAGCRAPRPTESSGEVNRRATPDGGNRGRPMGACRTQRPPRQRGVQEATVVGRIPRAWRSPWRPGGRPPCCPRNQVCVEGGHRRPPPGPPDPPNVGEVVPNPMPPAPRCGWWCSTAQPGLQLACPASSRREGDGHVLQRLRSGPRSPPAPQPHESSSARAVIAGGSGVFI